MTLSGKSIKIAVNHIIHAILLVPLVGCLSESRRQEKSIGHNNLGVEAKSKPTKDSMTEWSAFSVFHPESALSEDSFGLSLNSNTRAGMTEEKATLEQPNSSEPSIILGANALIPILRATFGNQARSSDSPDENSWFTIHPSDLFTPFELKSLCGNLKITEFDETENICWRPQLTQEYLVSLANFSADACTKLVERESKSENLNSNKLLRGKPFTSEYLRTFSIRHLRMPKHAITNEWLQKITDDASTYLKLDLKFENPDSPDSAEVAALEKAIFSCRAAINSKEFYSR